MPADWCSRAPRSVTGGRGVGWSRSRRRPSRGESGGRVEAAGPASRRVSRARAMRSTWLRPDAGGMTGLDALVEDDDADPVAAAGQDEPEGGRDLREDEVLLAVDRAEPHRRRVVEQQPGGDLAVLDVLPHVGGVGARGDVPLDVAQVVAGLVLAQVGEVEPVAAEQAAVVALEAAVEPAHDPPLELPEQSLRRQRGGLVHGEPPGLCPPGTPAWAGRSRSGVCGTGTESRIGVSRSSALMSSASAS